MTDSNNPQSHGMPMFPDPVNPNDLGRGPVVMGVTWTFNALALIVVATRFWIRIAVTKVLGVEDWLMLAAVVGFSPQGIMLATHLDIQTFRPSTRYSKYSSLLPSKMATASTTEISLSSSSLPRPNGHGWQLRPVSCVPYLPGSP